MTAETEAAQDALQQLSEQAGLTDLQLALPNLINPDNGERW